MAEPDTPVPEQPEPALPPNAAASANPAFMQNLEAKLRALPMWLVLAGALALGLAAGGVWYLLRGVFEALFARTP